MEDFGELIGNLTQNAKASLVSADLWSQLTNSNYIGTEHLLLGILAQPEAIATKFLNDVGVTFDKVRNLLGVQDGKNLTDLAAIKVLSESARLSIGMGWSVAREYNQQHLGTEHILYAMLEQKNSQVHALLVKMDADIEELRDQLRQYFDRQLLKLARSEVDGRNFVSDQKKLAQNSILRRFGTNLTGMAAAGQLDPVLARDREVERVITVLSRRTKSNPVLVGEPGVGKSAIVEGLAQRIAAGQVPASLIDSQIIELDLTGLVAGTKFRGEFEERIHRVIDELKADRRLIVFVDELHLLVGAGSSEGSIDAANVLKPALARGQIKLIGATTFDDYRKYIEKDAALERRFQLIDVLEPSREQAIAMLRGISRKYADHHNISLNDDVIIAAVDLSTRYISERFLPDKAIDLIDEAAAMLKVKNGYISPGVQKKIKKLNIMRLNLEEAINTEDFQRAAELKTKFDGLYKEIHQPPKSTKKPMELTVDDVARAVSLRTGVPVQQIEKNQQARLIGLEEILAKRVVGQSEAIKLVSDALKRSRSGVASGNRPIGSFIFMGPSGVGKTELARVIAEEMFGGKDALLKIDMSEFSEKHTISGLLGATAGYVGYDDSAKLTDAVRRRPYRVVLFDEIEKASPEIFNILLQILEDGSLADAKGRKVDFTNTIIILTSNLGSERLTKNDDLGFGKSSQDEAGLVVRRDLAKFMRPELINRFDGVVVFKHLDVASLNKIASLLLYDLQKRINNLGYGLKIRHSLKRQLVSETAQQNGGARPLRRLIESELERPISEAIISGKVKKGDTVILDTNKLGEVVLESHNTETVKVR